MKIFTNITGFILADIISLLSLLGINKFVKKISCLFYKMVFLHGKIRPNTTQVKVRNLLD